MATLILTSLLLVLLVAFLFETWVHNRRWKRIPIRIHVNGTRGKSSTTRLIAAGMRSTGKVVVAKTTGTTARVILPNGRELPLFRPLGANIREQFRVVRLASQLKADVLVIECMALQPELQWLAERWFVHATHGVITNCRPDHLDVMGPDSRGVALALSGSIPRRGILYTAERTHLPVLKEACVDRATELVTIGPEAVQDVGPEVLKGFRHQEHPANVALALDLCERLGADRSKALASMWDSEPDVGAKYVMKLDFFGRDIIFVNGFAANDPESSLEAWTAAVEMYGAGRQRVALMNCRADRADRSRQHGADLGRWPGLDHVIVMGTGTTVFSRQAIASGVDSTRLTLIEGASAQAVMERLVAFANDAPVLVVGLCNIGGEGLELVQLVRNRSHLLSISESVAA